MFNYYTMSNQIFANKETFYPFIDSTASVLTDKGGLLSSDGNNIVQVPGNILDNLILTTDASQSSGLKWETQSTFNNLGQAINLANQTTNSTVFVNALSTNLILAGGSYIINFSCDIFHDTVGNEVFVRFVDNAVDVGISATTSIKTINLNFLANAIPAGSRNFTIQYLNQTGVGLANISNARIYIMRVGTI